MADGGLLMNLSPLGSGLSTLGSSVPEAAEKNMHAACLELEGEIKERAPVDTGHLRASYTSRVERQGNTVIGHTGTNVPYSIHQEYYGTAHVRPALDAKEKDLIKIMGEQTLTDALSDV